MRLAIVGSRNWTDWETFCKYVQTCLTKWGYDKEDSASLQIECVVSGGAKGVDSMARRWAKENGVKCEEYLPDWNKYGRGAGPIRNSKIIELATHVIAFPSRSGRGTQDSIRKALSAEKSIEVMWID
jgi:hypothetical protein